MNSFVRFRRIAVQLALFVTFVSGAIAYPFDINITLGLFIGGLSGIIGFWFMARALEKVETGSGNTVKSAAYKWSVIRFLLAGAAIWKGYTWDPVTLHGFMGAVAGVFIMQVVVAFLGMTGLDLTGEEKK